MEFQTEQFNKKKTAKYAVKERQEQCSILLNIWVAIVTMNNN